MFYVSRKEAFLNISEAYEGIPFFIVQKGVLFESLHIFGKRKNSRGDSSYKMSHFLVIYRAIYQKYLEIDLSILSLIHWLKILTKSKMRHHPGTIPIHKKDRKAEEEKWKSKRKVSVIAFNDRAELED